MLQEMELGRKFCKCSSYFKTHYEWRPEWL